MARLGRRVARHHGFDRHGLHHQAFALHQEGEALLVGGLERFGNGGQRARSSAIAVHQAKGTTSAESLPS
jgi:hypothetical protein